MNIFFLFCLFVFSVFIAVITWLVAKKRWKALLVIGGLVGIAVVSVVGMYYFERYQEEEMYRKQNELIGAGWEAYGREDFSSALGYFKRVAENYNSPIMETKVAMMYYYGEGTDVDYAEARRWLERAAGKDHPEAKELLNTLDFSPKKAVSEPEVVAEPPVESGTSEVVSFDLDAPVNLPQYGCFPADNEYVCYVNKKGQQFYLKSIIDEGEQTIQISASPTVFNSVTYLLTSSDGDTFEFTEYMKGFNIPVYGYKVVKLLKKLKVKVSKDWKWVELYDGTVYDIPVSKEVYDKIFAYKKDLVEKGRQQFMMGGYSGGVSSFSNGGGIDASFSSGSFDSKKKCPYCNNGICSKCNGYGVVFNNYGGEYDKCPSCLGRGKCRVCYGTGYIRY